MEKASRKCRAVHNRSRIVRSAEGMEKAALGFQNLLRRGPAVETHEQRRKNVPAIFGIIVRIY